MDWFSGILDVTYRDDTKTKVFGISFHAAQRWLDEQPPGDIIDAMYHPSTISMKGDHHAPSSPR